MNSTYNSLAGFLEPRLQERLELRLQLHLLQEHGWRLQLPRHRARHLQHQQPLGSVGIRYAARRDRQLHLRSAVLQGTEQHAEKLLGGWEIAGATQFQTGTPCGIGTNNDYAGVGEFGSFGCGSEGQFWVLNGAAPSLPGLLPDRSLIRVRPSISPPMPRSRRPALSTCSPACATPFTSPASGLEHRAAEDIHDQRTEQLPVPRRGLRLHQPSEPERSEPESDFQPVRHDHQQDGPGAQPATFAALQLLTAEPIAA